MGRRKIEIKAIKDDRNRSVTFLKRKGGLFKKAHELSVLCSVDVAVIIFGNNKKLYEYSSSDIGEILQRYNFYGGPNERKGPADFIGKKDLDDDDDDDMGSMPNSPHSQEPPMLPPQFQNQPAYQLMQHHTPSASPPIPNGAPFHHVQRQHTPQPQINSRPSSRNAPQRPTSNLAQQMAQPPPGAPVNGYAYMPQPAIYQPPNGPMQSHPKPVPQQPPTFQYSAPPPQPLQMHQVYMEDQRRSSMPAAFAPHERPPSVGPGATPPQSRHQTLPQGQLQQQMPSQQMPPQQMPPQMPPQQMPPQQMPSQQMPSQQMPPQQIPPQPPHMQEQPQNHPPPQAKRISVRSVKSKSIFTPIDESRSILSQHWQTSSTSTAETSRGETATSSRSLSVDGGMARKNGASSSPPLPTRAQTHVKARNPSISSVADIFTPPSRSNSGQLGAKRPRLKVQIPEEASDAASGTGDSESAHDTDATGTNPSRRGGTEGSLSSGVVLPPPSPSASALLSAGASGPPNPFARPHPPPQSSQPNNNNNSSSSNNIDTPVSALPSRFMNNDFLPSPSSFYPEWNFRGSDSNTLPSPLNFATPIVGSGPSFLRDDNIPTKRKTPESEEVGGDSKRTKYDN